MIAIPTTITKCNNFVPIDNMILSDQLPSPQPQPQAPLQPLPNTTILIRPIEQSLPFNICHCLIELFSAILVVKWETTATGATKDNIRSTTKPPLPAKKKVLFSELPVVRNFVLQQCCWSDDVEASLGTWYSCMSRCRSIPWDLCGTYRIIHCCDWRSYLWADDCTGTNDWCQCCNTNANANRSIQLYLLPYDYCWCNNFPQIPTANAAISIMFECLPVVRCF